MLNFKFYELKDTVKEADDSDTVVDHVGGYHSALPASLLLLSIACVMALYLRYRSRRSAKRGQLYSLVNA